MFLLDTNAVSELTRHPGGAVERRAATIWQRRVVTSIVVAAELRFGLAINPSERLDRQMTLILSTLPVLPSGMALTTTMLACAPTSSGAARRSARTTC